MTIYKCSRPEPQKEARQFPSPPESYMHSAVELASTEFSRDYLLDMLESLLELDKTLFLRINGDWSHPLLDWILPILTDLHKQPLFVLLVVPTILGIWIFKQRLFAIKVLLGLIVAVGVTDFVNSKVLKTYFKRPRPSISKVQVNARSKHSNGWSFPSTHAANNFAGAIFFSLVYPGRRSLFLLIAFLVGYSRVYVGVHYPLDVVAGALWASLFAGEIFRWWRKIVPMKTPSRTRAL